MSEAEEEIASAFSFPDLPTVEQQIRAIEAPIQARYAEEIALDSEVVDEVLRTGSNRSKGQLRLIYNFMVEKTPEEYTEFVKNEYGTGGKGFEIGGAKYAVWFDDLGMRKKQFTGLVLSVLILEDILAIVLMVMLSTMAVSHNFEGTEMLGSIAKLLFFLILWFVVGIYLIPGLLKRCRKLMSEETLLIVSLGLCFGMVVMAAHTGFSAAFGAFIMGSILAETVEAESIERLVKPVKDLFGAIFFVSVGMMVDPAMIVEYAGPIVVITLAVILGQSLFGTLGVLLAGQPLKTAMQCGFSLTQIGEFAFIIASLGVSLHVTSHFLYPIVVAVSVITTFLTPYMIRLAEPASNLVDTHLPEKWRKFLTRYASGSQTMNHESLWKKLIFALVRITVVYSIICVAVIALAFRFLVPFVHDSLPGVWGSLLAAFIIILCIAPFLRVPS